MQKRIYLGNEILAILNICVKRKNAFILKPVRDGAILMTFVTHKVSAECTGDISEKITFGGHLEFLCKMQKRIYLGNEILAAILNFGRN